MQVKAKTVLTYMHTKVITCINTCTTAQSENSVPLIWNISIFV